MANTPTRRPSAAPAQAQLDTRAIEIARGAEARIDGHEDLCAERFKNLDGKVDTLKQDQKENHRANQVWLQKLDEKLVDIAGQRTGAQWLGMTIKDWLLVAFAATAIFVNLTKHL